MNRLLKHPAIPILTALLMIGCASLGLATPKTFEERLAYAYNQHTAALQTITNTTNLRLISSRDAVALLAIADQSRLLLDSSRMAFSGADLQSAEGRLVLATNVLRELENYMVTRTSAQRGPT